MVKASFWSPEFVFISFCYATIFFDIQLAGLHFVGFSLLSLLVSLALSFWEISISVKALQVHLSDLIQK